MIEDIHEPVENYKSFFRDAHAHNTSGFFEDLVNKSGVDETANIQTVKELRTLEQKVTNENSHSRNWRILRGVTIALFVIGICVILNQYSKWWIIGLALVLGLPIYKLNKIVHEVKIRLSQLEIHRDDKRAEAWQQMSSLNRLYDWDIVGKLVRQTVPRIELDAYFTNGRLAELHDTFGFDDQFNHNQRSIIFSHSGVLNGNPFVMARTLEHWMGEKTYNGSLNISWTESKIDSKGNRTTVTRHQTLHASVTKPFPSYGHRTFIIYGNEAAPDLSFSRQPSNLSKLDNGFINNMRKKRAEKALEKKSRDLKDGFTLMSNREFDTLFGASDRDHEVQFRLLFTPLAQQEMLNILKDKEIGYGDDFVFVKQQMVNMVEPDHMTAIDISGNPELFHAYELTHARKFFNEYHNNLFRSFYFGIAPILTIPLYQQHRSNSDIYKDVYASKSCFWEHEAIANYFGEKIFQHPQCITNSILKTQAMTESDCTQTICVTASGYRGEDRADYVSVRGGDGYNHKVRVNWVEYLDVQRESNMVVKEKTPIQLDTTSSDNTDDENWQELFKNRGIDTKNVLLRRSIMSALLPNQ
ncbi:MAG1210 family protein [Oryzomonas rubra]|uniref:Uncharacterized protein n=1 Tax=Oryzomonas rubra TaxID=2509454 RepID=A0A5A9XM71_9BACT|nr:hypothetical protein [Oryzomonas rubra]KAA0894227.1 hypothetical protein ET418_04535 [Oryzomonas rubra]